MRVTDGFLDRLKKLMDDRGLNMADLARLLHTQPSTLTRWNRGSQPQRNTLLLLAKVLNVEFEWLATGTGPQQAPARPPMGMPQEQAAGRMMESGFTREPEGFPKSALLEDVLSAIGMEELLGMVERLNGKPAAIRAVLSEIRRRANYFQKPPQKEQSQ